MQSYPVLPSSAVDRATDQLIAVAAAVDAAALREAEDLALRLTPDLWPMEWHLPFWLGCDFGLTEAAWQQLVLVNLLGAGYVRLTDDLADEMLDQPRQTVKAALGQCLLEASTTVLQALFAPSSAFWRSYQTYLDQWRQAGEGEGGWRDEVGERVVEDWQLLAWRGAPAKITATGACWLARRAELIGPLETCIDHSMAAAVLLDHADDWRDDLAAGRFNAYVAWLSGLPQRSENIARNRQQVLSDLMQDDGAGHRAYFGLIDQHLLQAQAAAALVGSAGLSAYLAAIRQDAHTLADGQLASARKTFQDALASLLADYPTQVG